MKYGSLALDGELRTQRFGGKSTIIEVVRR